MAVAYYGDRISPHMTDTPEGFLICHDVPIARTGPQDYLAREMMLDGDPERIVTVQRHPEDVFEAATLASFEGKPVTDGHPPENVGPENYSAYTKGHVQNVRRSGDYIVADLYINDANLAEEVRNNVKREVSCGYLCSYVPDGAGYRQSNIRGNHVAVVPKGRAGAAVAIQDTAPEAEKGGNKHMNEFWKSVLHAFGMAAKDASPEELDKMVETTATALDAEPAEKAQEAEPAESKTAEDEMVEKAPKGDDLGSKLDRIISMLEAKSRGGEGEHRLHDESDIDEEIKRLLGKEEEGKSITIPVENDACMDDATKDAAVAVLRKVRPAVAAIEDKHARAKVTDALLSAVRGKDVMGEIAKAAQDSARAAAEKTSKNTYETMCAESEAAYAARNPHKKKED
nr:MAG TPA: hypothetical protein [Caudoviricetes sp.]